MSYSKESLSELVIVFVAVLIGVLLFTPISNLCNDIVNPVNASGSAMVSNASALTKVFVTLIPFAYILIVFGVAIAVVIKILK